MSLTAPAPEGFRAPVAGDTLVAGPGPVVKDHEVVDADDARKGSPEEAGGAEVLGGAEAAQPKDARGAEPSEAVMKTGELAGAGGAADVAKATDDAAKAGAPHAKLVVPAGSLGLAAAPEGILLRYSPDSRSWERLTGPTPLAASSRLLCLFPTRTAVAIGKAEVLMLGECELRVLPQSTEAAPAIELAQGWLLVRPETSTTLKVGLGDRLITLEVPQNGCAAVERSARWVYGRLVSPVPPLVVHGVSGEITVTVGAKQEVLAPLDVLSIDRSSVKRSTEDASPMWASDAWPTPEEVKARDDFAKVLHRGRPILTEIVAAVEESNVHTKQFAVAALKSMGEMSYLMPLLSRKDDSAVRQGALAGVRLYTALGPEAAAKVNEQLVEEFGDETAAMAGKMIVGFSPQEAASPQLFSELIELLSPAEQSVGVRALAVDTLKRLTGKGDMGYDPDHPEAGHAAWVDLEREGKLRPTAPAKAPRGRRHRQRPRRNKPDDFVLRPVPAGRAWSKPAGYVIVYPVGIDALEGRFFLARSKQRPPTAGFPEAEGHRAMQLF